MLIFVFYIFWYIICVFCCFGGSLFVFVVVFCCDFLLFFYLVFLFVSDIFCSLVIFFVRVFVYLYFFVVVVY